MGAAKKLTEQEQHFVRNLAAFPYCCNGDYKDNRPRPKQDALKLQLIQPNRERLTSYLVFDVDTVLAALAWEDAGLPPPLFTTTNRANGHAHICYALSVPFSTSALSKLSVLKYVAAIQEAYRFKLGADLGYSGLLTKNPFNPTWLTCWWTYHAYSLDELADYVNLPKKPKLKEVAQDCAGLGRNCYLFENVRAWSYSAIRQYWRPDYQDDWLNAVMSHAELLNNAFPLPLRSNEVRAIAKSIAKWTYAHFTPSKFREIQSARGKIGGKIGGKVSKGGGRPKSVDHNLHIKIQTAKATGLSNRAIAQALTISASTVSKYLKLE